MTPGLVINTYNQPEYLGRVLRAVSRQSLRPLEVVLADDGSGPETKVVFDQWSQTTPVRCAHAWQANEGFRRSRILNLAIARSTADYLIFLDGDTVPHPRFIEDHLEVARAGAFVQGHRSLVEQKAAPWFGLNGFQGERLRALCSGQLSGWKHAFRWPMALKRFRSDLHGIRGCNLGIWRTDLVAVNGYNEAFVGWGREDSELAVRLMNRGVRRLDVRGRMPCFHLWHPPASRSSLQNNDALLDEARRSGTTRCDKGLDQHLGRS
jgi:glycosyltransferase involved in cell wall biosynthesis